MLKLGKILEKNLKILYNMIWKRHKQGSHRLEKYMKLEGFLEKSLKIKYALRSTGKSLQCLEKSLYFSIFYRDLTLLIEI